MKKYTHLLFDADHTIFDFDQSQDNSLHLAFSDMGLKLTETFRQAYDRINKACWIALEKGEINRAQLQERRANQFQQVVGDGFDPYRFHDLYINHLSQQVDYLPRAKESMMELSEHYTLAMITNGLAPVQKPRLAKSGIEHLFDQITISGEINLAKPDAAFFDHTFRGLGNPDRSKALVIGDNLLADIYGGHQAGCDTCWITTSNLKVEQNVKPTYQVSDWNEIRKLLL